VAVSEPGGSSDAPTVRLEVADGVGVLRLDRPPVNALNARMQDLLRVVADEAATRDDVRAVVLYGGERSFAAGADVKEMATMTHEQMLARSGPLQEAFTAVARIPKPVAAAITGYALGGGLELALAADVRFCAEDAKLGQPEILLGVIPGAGGTQRLARLVGPSRAKELVFTGRTLDAYDALRLGIVNRVVPAADVLATAMAWAARLATGPAVALAAAKRAIDEGLDAGMDAGLALERDLFASLFATEDREIGMRSFVDEGPGKAKFRGR
jgi:enoyl-CoA hydratase/carnithine racemase